MGLAKALYQETKLNTEKTFSVSSESLSAVKDAQFEFDEFEQLQKDGKIMITDSVRENVSGHNYRVLLSFRRIQ